MRIYEVTANGRNAIYHAIIAANSVKEAIELASKHDNEQDPWGPWKYNGIELKNLKPEGITDPAIVCAAGYYE